MNTFVLAPNDLADAYNRRINNVSPFVFFAYNETFPNQMINPSLACVLADKVAKGSRGPSSAGSSISAKSGWLSSLFVLVVAGVLY